VSAVGLPAIYVPLPHGNGEQRLNALPVVEHGGGEIVEDADLTPARVVELAVPLLTSGERLSAMSAGARRTGHADADETLARMVLEVAEAAAGEGDPQGTMGGVRHEENDQ
jgi:UDP-N-acetylglucosamine--N-acetylmuramyl-(pentapeptide) pyrophosphoryl-undecaprenol N-acetylglucosamine transferase